MGFRRANGDHNNLGINGSSYDEAGAVARTIRKLALTSRPPALDRTDRVQFTRRLRGPSFRAFCEANHYFDPSPILPPKA